MKIWVCLGVALFYFIFFPKSWWVRPPNMSWSRIISTSDWYKELFFNLKELQWPSLYRSYMLIRLKDVYILSYYKNVFLGILLESGWELLQIITIVWFVIGC